MKYYLIMNILRRTLYSFGKKLKIEYCNTWGGRNAFNLVKDKVYVQDPTIKVEGSGSISSNYKNNIDLGKFEVILIEDGKPDKQLWSRSKGDPHVNPENIGKILDALKWTWR